MFVLIISSFSKANVKKWSEQENDAFRRLLSLFFFFTSTATTTTKTEIYDKNIIYCTTTQMWLDIRLLHAFHDTHAKSLV